MALRVYIVPIVGTVGSMVDPLGPKYFIDGTIPSTRWASASYGDEPWTIVSADLSATDHATINAQADAFIIPATLDNTLTNAQVTNVQAKLEAITIPAGWVTTALTWRTVLRIVLWMCAFMQRCEYLNGGLVFTGGITLATTVGQLSAGTRAVFLQAAADQALSTAGITNATTLRAGLKALADQSAARPYSLGALTL